MITIATNQPGQTHAEMRNLCFEIVVGPLAQRDLVAARWTGHGEAGNAPVTFAGNDILRIRAAKIAEYWVATTSSR